MCSKGNLKRMIHMNLGTKQKETHRLRERTMVRWEGIIREFGTNMYTLLYLKWRTNKALL